MAVFAISDLHLPGGAEKPMDIFGPQWSGHFEKIASDWRARVKDGDIVLLPGDLSWAMTLDKAVEDIKAVASLPGQKVILRGNHDYWWSAIGRVRDALPEGMYALQNDSVVLDGKVICGTRGWLLPGEESTAEDKKIYRREISRLELSLKDARRRDSVSPLLCMTHYPPVSEGNMDTEGMRLLKEYGVRDLVYGHLHGASLKGAVRGEFDGIRFHPVSCDGLNFTMYSLPDE